MSLVSFNTNVGAMAALRTLGEVQADLGVSQARLSTGHAVRSVRDDPAAWRIATAHRGDIRALEVVDGSLSRAGSALEVAITAGETVSDLLAELKAKALAAGDASLDTASRGALDSDFRALRDRIAAVVENAQFGGMNLVGAGATDQQALAWHTVSTTTTVQNAPGGAPGKGNGNGNGNGGAGNGGGNGGGGNGKGNGKGKGVTLAAAAKPAAPTVVSTSSPTRMTIRAASLALGGANVTLTASASVATVTQAAGALAQINASLANVGRAVARFGADHGAVTRQLGVVRGAQNRLGAAVANLVDADLGRESARAAALQVREALAVQALGLANTAPSMLLPLFGSRAV